MKNNIILGLVIILITSLLGILIAFILLWNTKISWVVCDTYGDYKDCYRVVVKFGDYFLRGEDCNEEYENI